MIEVKDLASHVYRHVAGGLVENSVDWGQSGESEVGYCGVHIACDRWGVGAFEHKG